MKNLNENIARKANKEDHVKGHFWESRYKCQALLDDKAVLAAMTYVDLNPIRSVMAETPEDSEFTSIYERIKEAKKYPRSGCSNRTPDSLIGKSLSVELPPASLMSFDPTGNEPLKIPFALHDYFELIDWSGRLFHPDKRGVVDENVPPVLKRIGIERSNLFSVPVILSMFLVLLSDRHQSWLNAVPGDR